MVMRGLEWLKNDSLKLALTVIVQKFSIAEGSGSTIVKDANGVFQPLKSSHV